jgi:predicted HicB family RNase H-like nuclease
MKRKEVKSVQAQTNFRLDGETHKALRIAAIEEGVSMAEALRQAIELWLKDRKRARKEGKK